MKKIWSIASILAVTLLLGACTLTITGEADPVPTRTQPVNRPAPTTPTPVNVPPSRVVPNFPTGQVIQYQCTDARLLVEYTSNDSARVNFNGWNNLTRSVITDGWFTYTNADYTWHAFGKEGYLKRGDEIVRRNCTY